MEDKLMTVNTEIMGPVREAEHAALVCEKKAKEALERLLALDQKAADLEIQLSQHGLFLSENSDGFVVLTEPPKRRASLRVKQSASRKHLLALLQSSPSPDMDGEDVVVELDDTARSQRTPASPVLSSYFDAASNDDQPSHERATTHTAAHSVRVAGEPARLNAASSSNHSTHSTNASSSHATPCVSAGRHNGSNNSEHSTPSTNASFSHATPSSPSSCDNTDLTSGSARDKTRKRRSRKARPPKHELVTNTPVSAFQRNLKERHLDKSPKDLASMEKRLQQAEESLNTYREMVASGATAEALSQYALPLLTAVAVSSDTVKEDDHSCLSQISTIDTTTDTSSSPRPPPSHEHALAAAVYALRAQTALLKNDYTRALEHMDEAYRLDKTVMRRLNLSTRMRPAA